MRLWEQDAAAAITRGLTGMAVLSPLMGGATSALAERAAALVLELDAQNPQRADC